MQVRIKVENKTKNVKYVRVKFSPMEWLVVRKAMRCFADDKKVNQEDRKIIHGLLNVKPTQKYVKAEGGKRDERGAT